METRQNNNKFLKTKKKKIKSWGRIQLIPKGGYKCNFSISKGRGKDPLC
jgi:hypothetical protein